MAILEIRSVGGGEGLRKGEEERVSEDDNEIAKFQ